MRADVLVVGAGLAGLWTATELARRGHDVVLADRRTRLDATVRTTGIFVRRTLEDFDLPPEHLGPPIRRMVLYPPSHRNPVTLDSAHDEFRVGDMAPLYLELATRAAAAGVRLELGTRYLGRQDGAHLLHGPGGPVEVRATFVVGADGARSAVARELGLDRNRELLVGAEEVFAVPHRPAAVPAFHCVLDPRLAPGYLAWVLDDGRHAHVGVAGYADRYPHGLRDALRRFAASAPGLAGLPRPEAVERRAGPIPVGGLLRRIAGPHGLLVGDAAGAVSPLTAGGLDPCLRLSAHAADVLDRALRTGDRRELAAYDGAALRARFRGRLTMRRGLSLVRTPAVAAAGVAALRTTPGRAAARRILFGHGSFPEPRTAGAPQLRLARYP
ncbi:NAD(P)/FAD-dependent oxidoreductase [Krasilnikoviella flava]|uniref:Dehydrogenase (Flavoprotein) n=1 Tax=Krasilnikoviella flava TaxID=526729 RepID=A0A1T5KA58_9MICO|nr:NAD(P)/FAD-dependent oxidoreductase [Krasilnikoviella flava]SKC60556.1 Dehydrogenase (flavoprotein) [Krasilnikoviella flava]